MDKDKSKFAIIRAKNKKKVKLKEYFDIPYKSIHLPKLKAMLKSILSKKLGVTGDIKKEINRRNKIINLANRKG